MADDNRQQGGGEAAPTITWEQMRGAIPPELAGEKVWESIKDPATLFKSYVEAQKMIGGSVRIPKEGAPKEEWEAFYAKLGRPEKPEEYGEFQVPDDFKELWNRDTEKSFVTKAHELGLTKRQVDELRKWHLDSMTTLLGQTAQERKAQEQAAWSELRRRWGANTDRNVSIVQQAVAKVGGERLAEKLDRTGLGNDPDWLEFAFRLGESLIEDGILSPQTGGVSKDAALAEIAKLEGSEAYTKREHPDHGQVIKRLSELYAVAYPG